MTTGFSEFKEYNRAFYLTKTERFLFSKFIEKEIKLHEARIDKIRNNPKNEGQISFISKIDSLKLVITDLKEQLKMLS